MPAKKRTAKKAETKSSPKPAMCMRYVDSNTLIMSDDENLKPAEEAKQSQELPKGMRQLDANTIIKE